jgi:hypothetical protein
MKRLAVGLATVALLATGCSSSGNSAPRGFTSRPATLSSPAASAALTGTWQTAVVTPDEMVAALRAAGLQKWIQPFRARSGVAQSNVFTLTINSGRWSQDWSKDGGTSSNNDFGIYTISGDQVVITHGAGTDTFRWSVVGTTLTLTFVESAGIGPYKGIPEEVMQRAFYAASMQRQG